MTNLQVALRLTNPIDASGTVALNDSGSGINDQNNFGHISASSLGATSFTWVTPIFTSAPNPITLADVGGGTLIAELFGVSPKTLTSNGAWIEGPVFNVPARNAQTVDAKIGQNYKMSDPLITVQNTNGFFGGTGTARTVSSTGGTATRQYSLSDGTETVYVAYETADTVNQGPGATPFEWRNILSYVMKHKTRLTISTSGLTISDEQPRACRNLRRRSPIETSGRRRIWVCFGHGVRVDPGLGVWRRAASASKCERREHTGCHQRFRGFTHHIEVRHHPFSCLDGIDPSDGSRVRHSERPQRPSHLVFRNGRFRHNDRSEGHHRSAWQDTYPHRFERRRVRLAVKAQLAHKCNGVASGVDRDRCHPEWGM